MATGGWVADVAVGGWGADVAVGGWGADVAGVLTWLGLLTWQWAADVAPRPFPMPRGSGLGFSYCSADAWTSRS